MGIESTGIAGLHVLDWPTHGDERGFFRQTYQTHEVEEAIGRPFVVRQSNHARSTPGVLRGFHAEPWDKCVYVARGTVFAAIADIRPESPTFGEVATFRLGDAPGERLRLFVSEGLANAYLVEDNGEADYLYDVSATWFAADKRAVAWDDPDLDVPWPIDTPRLSAEDRGNPTLRERFPERHWGAPR